MEADKNTLVNDNIHLARDAAKFFVRRYPSARRHVKDLAQEAAIGLMRAAESWDPALGPFVPHARVACTQALLKQVGGLMRLESNADGFEPDHTETTCPGESPDASTHASMGYALFERFLADIDFSNRVRNGAVSQTAEIFRRVTLGESREAVGADLGITRARVGQILEPVTERFAAYVARLNEEGK